MSEYQNVRYKAAIAVRNQDAYNVNDPKKTAFPPKVEPRLCCIEEEGFPATLELGGNALELEGKMNILIYSWTAAIY